MYRSCPASLLFALAFVASEATAANLATWQAAGSINSAFPLAATYADSGTAAGKLVASGVTPAIATDVFIATGWTSHPPQPTAYLEVAIAPVVGMEIDFTQFQALLVEDDVLIDLLEWELRSSADCYATVIASGTADTSGSSEPVGTATIKPSLAALSPQAGTTTFRLSISASTPTVVPIGTSLVNLKGTVAAGGTTPLVRVSTPDFCNGVAIANPLIVDAGYLYVGAWDSSFINQLWRTPDRITWESVDLGGLGANPNFGMSLSPAFFGKYYVGTHNVSTGGEVYSTDDFETWTLVSAGGFGDPLNENINFGPGCCVFGSHLYAGTVNYTTGGAIWRSSDGTSWTKTSPDGFGAAAAFSVRPLAVFGGQIFATAYLDLTPFPWQSTIWRSSDGVTWFDTTPEPVVEGQISMSVFDGFLYAAFEDELWRTGDGVAWIQIMANGPFGAGTDAERILLSVHDGTFIARTLNSTSGGGVWQSFNGSNWIPIFEDGLGNPDNALIGGPIEFDGHLIWTVIEGFTSSSSSFSGASAYSGPLVAPPVPIPGIALVGILGGTLAFGITSLRRRQNRS